MVKDAMESIYIAGHYDTFFQLDTISSHAELITASNCGTIDRGRNFELKGDTSHWCRLSHR